MSTFSEEDIRILKALDGPLPLVEEPFAEMAARAGVTEEKVLERISAWAGDKTIRRFGARVNHHSIGYTANGMSVWKVPAEQIERVAEAMTSRKEVSHCYMRPTRPGWDYNMFAMIHGMTEEDVWRVTCEIAETTGLKDFDVLFSTREFKKSAPEYFVEEDN